jgi:lipoprotein signal peptidase
LAWFKVIIKKTIKHQNNPYSVIPIHDHQTLNVSSNLIRLHRHKNRGMFFAMLL